MPEETPFDKTKYVSIDDPCPCCGASDMIDSTDDDSGPYGPNGEQRTIEKWSCGACGAAWDAIMQFVELELVHGPKGDR